MTILASLIGGAFSLFGASRAASAQTAAAREQLDLYRDIYEEQSENFSPYLAGGTNALNALLFEYGLGPRPTFGDPSMGIEERTRTITDEIGGFDYVPVGRDDHDWRPATRTRDETYYSVGDRDFGTREAAQDYLNSQGTPYGGYTASPGYARRLSEGINALDASAAAGGDLFSGAQGQRLVQFGQDHAENDRSNYLNRLRDLAGVGMGAAGNQATAGSNFAAGGASALANRGNAQAAGWIGATNSLNNMLTNIVGYQNYNNMVRPS